MVTQNEVEQNGRTSRFGRYFFVCGTLFGIISCGLILVIGMVFETNDDREFSSILAGSFGLDNAGYTVFLNYGLSLFYKGVFQLLGTELNWYVACSLIASCIALAAIQSIVLDTVRSPYRWVLIVAIYLFVVHDQFLSFQFTKNAAFYTAAACLCLTVAIVRQNNSVLLSAVSGFLLVLGCLTRDKAALIVIAFYIPLTIELLLRSRLCGESSPKSARGALIGKSFCSPMAALAAAAILIVACTLLNQAAYSTRPWSEYLEINDINFSLLSGGELPDYQGNEGLYSSLGLDLNDYDLYSDWSGGDSEVFSREVVESLSEVGQSSHKMAGVEQLINTLASERGVEFQLLLVLLTAVAALLVTNRLGRVGVFVILLVLGVEVGYLLISGSFSHRVFYSGVVGALSALFALCLAPQTRGSGLRLTLGRGIMTGDFLVLTCCLLATILSGMYAVKNYAETDVKWKRDPSYSRLLDLVSEDKGHFYVFDRTTITYLAMNGKNPLRTTGVDDYSNMAYLGGWIALTPVNRSGLDRYGVQSGYELLGRVQEAYIVDSRHAEMICQFVKKHYCADARLVQVGQIGDTYIYRLSGIE